MKCVFVFIIITCSIVVFSQRPSFQFETFSGVQFNYSINDKQINEHVRGFTVPVGFRINCDLFYRVTLVAGYTFNNWFGDNFKFPVQKTLCLDLKFKIGHFKKFQNVDFTVESGLEVRKNSNFIIPVYLGSQFHLHSRLDWNTRFGAPVFIMLVNDNGYFKYADYRIETGLALRLNTGKEPKVIGKSGNPFILR